MERLQVACAVARAEHEYHILDFSKCTDDMEFAVMFRKLVDRPDLFYKEGEKENKNKIVATVQTVAQRLEPGWNGLPCEHDQVEPRQIGRQSQPKFVSPGAVGAVREDGPATQLHSPQ